MKKIKGLAIALLIGVLAGCGSTDKTLVEPSATSSVPESGATIKTQESIGETAKLTSAQVSQAVSLDKNNSRGMEFKIVVPTYVPTGFQVANFEAGEDDYGPMYAIAYRDANNSCFEISANSGGWGAGAEEYDTVEVSSPALGKVVVEYTNFDESRNTGYIGLKDAPIIQGEQGSERGYSFLSPAYNIRGCSSMDVSEAVKVVESLQYLNP